MLIENIPKYLQNICLEHKEAIISPYLPVQPPELPQLTSENRYLVDDKF